MNLEKVIENIPNIEKDKIEGLRKKITKLRDDAREKYKKEIEEEMKK